MYLKYVARQIHIMTTPAMVFSSVLKLMVISVGVFWIVSFAISRVFVFYEAYSAFLNVLKGEAWLRTQCALPEFYSNLRQHTDLCNAVRLNAERSPLLIALNEVASTAHLCGRFSCLEMLSNAGWPVILAAMMVVLLVPSVFFRVIRGVVHDEYLPRDNHNKHLKYL